MKMNYPNTDYIMCGKYGKDTSDFSQLARSASFLSSALCIKHLTNHNKITDLRSFMIHNYVLLLSDIILSQFYKNTGIFTANAHSVYELYVRKS